MVLKGIIFDFNGTLFPDTELHLEAWNEFAKSLREEPFTYDELVHNLLGRTNASCIEYCTGKKPTDEEVQDFTDKKESLYRQMCLNKGENLKLTLGAYEFLDKLKENNIPITIATGSEKSNVDFFIKVFNLKKWFDIDKIVYDNGKIKGKPHPQPYLNAAKNIGLKPEECIVFEDAALGVQSANAAGIGKICIIAPKNNYDFFNNLSEVDNVFNDFCEVNFDTIFDK